MAKGEPSGKGAHACQCCGLAVSLVPMFDENYLMLACLLRPQKSKHVV